MATKMTNKDSCAHLCKGTHGFYLKANRDISRGQVVFFLDGEEIDQPNQHSIQIDEHLHYQHAESLWRFTQHACNPTLRFDTQKKAMIAICDIKPNEELTYNYNSSEWSMSVPFQCHCHANNCVGEIKGFAYLSQTEREQLRPLLTTYLLSYLE